MSLPRDYHPWAGFPLPFNKDDLAFLSFCHLTYF